MLSLLCYYMLRITFDQGNKPVIFGRQLTIVIVRVSGCNFGRMKRDSCFFHFPAVMGSYLDVKMHKTLWIHQLVSSGLDRFERTGKRC